MVKEKQINKMNERKERLLIEHKITQEALMANGWVKDDELMWWNKGIQYDWVSSILWVRNDKGIHNVDSIKRLNECMAVIDDIEALENINRNYFNEF